MLTGRLTEVSAAAASSESIKALSIHFNSVAIQPDGKIVAAGSTSDGGNRGAVIRLNPNGSVDTTFANGGTFFYSFPNAAEYNGFHEIKILANGRILLGATIARNSAPRSCAVRRIFSFNARQSGKQRG